MHTRPMPSGTDTGHINPAAPITTVDVRMSDGEGGGTFLGSNR